jgi:hypothetical protein
MPLMLVAALVLFAIGQGFVVGAAAVVTLTVIVQVVAGLTICLALMVMVLVPAVAVTDPVPVHVPPMVLGAATTSPVGSVSVKLYVWVGLLAGWVTVNVSTLTPPTTMVVGANALVNTGTAALTVTHAPVVLVPLVALLAIADVMLVTAVMFASPLVLLASGQVPNVGVVLLVTGTMMVQVLAGLTI